MKEQIRKIPLRVKKVDTLELGVGAVLVLVSFLMPIIICIAFRCASTFFRRCTSLKRPF